MNRCAALTMSIQPAASSNSAIRMNLEELYRYANAESWVDVCKILEQA